MQAPVVDGEEVLSVVEVAFNVCVDSELDGDNKDFDLSLDSESSLCHS